MAKRSKRTSSLIKKRNIFFLLSLALWLGAAVATFVITMTKINAVDPSTGTPIFTDEFKALLASIGATVIIGLILAMVIKDKARTVVWMLSLLLLTIIYKEVGMYIVLGCWFLDEYVFYNLYKYYKNKVSINKEIDIRLEDDK